MPKIQTHIANILYITILIPYLNNTQRGGVMRPTRTVSILVAAALIGAACSGSKDYSSYDPESAPVVEQQLVAPPFVPVHDQVVKGPPRVVKVSMVIEEKLIKIDDEGTEIWAFTYGGTVPGPLMIVHQYDWVELTLENPSTNRLVHNVDFHAATGAMGGGSISFVAPGQKVVIRWQAIKSGVFIYHCAPGDAMIPYHVVKGMNGAVMVLPREGLKDGAGKPLRYDRAYYIGEQDFYVPKNSDGTYKKYLGSGEDMADMLKVMQTLTPTHVVFSGKKFALTGDNALTANVGEKVLFIHSQANRDTRPHIIGGHGDFVWQGGSFDNPPVVDKETWFVPGGSAVAAIYEFRYPGTYAYVNHSLIEAVLLGAVAHIKVEGPVNDRLMKQISAPKGQQHSGSH